MAKYTVAITEVVEYLVPVEAESEEAAEEAGMQMLVDSDNPDQWFVAVTARECDGVNTEEA